jgi:hypothetical protein
LGWVDKAQLKLFQEIGRKPKDCAMSARLRKAVNKAVRMLKIEGAKNENRLLSTFEVCSDVEAHETDLKKSKFNQENSLNQIFCLGQSHTLMIMHMKSL